MKGDNQTYHEWLAEQDQSPPMPRTKRELERAIRQAKPTPLAVEVLQTIGGFVVLIWIMALVSQCVAPAPKNEQPKRAMVPPTVQARAYQYPSEVIMADCLMRLNGDLLYCQMMCGRTREPERCDQFGKAWREWRTTGRKT